MAQFFEDRDRQIVPRWRSFASSVAFRELQPLNQRPSNTFDERMLADMLDDWHREPGLSVASDLISAAFSIGVVTPAKDAANFVMSHKNATPAAKEIAQQCLKEGESVNSAFNQFYGQPAFPGINDEIGRTRTRLSDYPLNPVLWTNLSLLFATVGKMEKAARAMRIAISLAPDNRFVVRSACRFFLHNSEIERAHDVVLRAPSLKTDPWLLSAEIAVSQLRQRRSRYVKLARDISESQNYSAFNISELTSALATEEAIAGNLRRAGRFCEHSMADPAENAIAQAAWLNRNIGPVWTSTVVSNQSSEAYSFSSGAAGDWPTAIQQSLKWQSEQPFSSRPAMFGSYIAATALDDFQTAEQMVRCGLYSNRDDPTLNNNLAFALAQMGQTTEAKEIISHAQHLNCTPVQRICITATKGIIEYRAGKADAGRILYLLAINMAAKARSDRLVATAKSYLAIEELRRRSTEAIAFARDAHEAVQKLKEPMRSLFVDKLNRAETQSGLKGPGK